MKIREIVLSERDRNKVSQILDAVAREPALCKEEAFLDAAHVIGHDLPPSIRQAFYDFKRQERDLALLVKNNPVGEGDVGPTPDRYVELEDTFVLNRAHILHGLYAALLGEPIGFDSQRDGRCYNNIIPLKELEQVANSSSGSAHKFDFHTEDAFHPCMGDYLGLVCMRNDEAAKTSITSVRDMALDDETKEILFADIFEIGHNFIHRVSGSVKYDKVPILFGSFDNPFMRINVCKLDVKAYPAPVAKALSTLKMQLDRNKFDVVLKSGECLYIDNFYSAHARDVYQPNYGPMARWLSRLIIARDLRKSAAFRERISSRVIHA